MALATSFREVDDRYEDDGADQRDENRPQIEPSDAVRTKQVHHKTADERSNDASYDVFHEAVVRLHDHGGYPSSQATYDDPRDNAHAVLLLELGDMSCTNAHACVLPYLPFGISKGR